jgi:hypothetical protein
MRGSRDQTSGEIAEVLQGLIERTRAERLELASQLLQMAQLELLMCHHGIAVDELDQLRHALERRGRTIEVLDLETVRRSRQQRLTRGR